MEPMGPMNFEPTDGLSRTTMPEGGAVPGD